MAADIRALELEFAKTPTLESCIPLCEAYLSDGRYMEAMVVCKKGAKASPQDPRGPVMLVRVYLEQGKIPKAQTELAKVMQQFPGNPTVLEAQGRVAMRTGDNASAVGFLQQALQLDPTLPSARAWLAEMGVAAPAAAPPQAAPVAQPGMMPQQQMPGMMPPQQMPGMMPQQQMPPGFPGAQPGFPGQPGAMPVQNPMAQPGMLPGGFPAAGQPGAAPSPFGPPGSQAQPGYGEPLPEHQLEHVSDFFSNEALGFNTDIGGPETAGPGRLTIVGFVPKSTGSIKTTIIVALAMLAVAAVVLTFVWISSQNKREINNYYGDILHAMAQDKFVEYKNVLKLSRQIFDIDSNHGLTLSTLAYAHAVLAAEHGEEESLPKAKELLRLATEASDQPNEWKVVATALIAHIEGQPDIGIKSIKDIVEKSSRPLVQMEHLRLQLDKDPTSEMSQKSLKRLIQAVTGEARVYNFLGWYYYMLEDWERADGNFANAMQNVRGHELALVGSALADLERGIGLKERQKEIDTSLRKVFGLPQEELSQPVRALAHFARSQLRNWQGKDDEAKSDYEKARKLDAKNALFPYRRGVGDLKLGDAESAVKYLKVATKLEPNNVRFLHRLGQAQTAADDLKGAAATLKRGLELAPDNGDLLMAHADLLRAEKKPKDAVAAYERLDVGKHGPINFADAQIGISKTLRGSRQAAAAVKHIEEFLKKAPKAISANVRLQAPIWEELGLANEAAGQSAKALEAFRVGIEQFRYYAPNMYQVCRALKFKGPEAKEHCKLYITLEPRGEHAAEVKRRFPGIAN